MFNRICCLYRIYRLNYRTADRKLDIGYIDSYRTAGPEVDAGAYVRVIGKLLTRY